MSADPRLSSVSNFTPTKHHQTPPSLNPSLIELPAHFTVCIIGASTGIGEHIAYAFAHAKASTIIISARTTSDLETVADRIRSINAGTTVQVARCDISSASSVRSLAELIKSKYDRLDILIPNAAYAPPVTLQIHEGEPGPVQMAFDVNVMGTYHAAHYFVPLLLDSPDGAKGLIAIGSLAGCIRRGIIANTGYTVSKMAQIRLVEYLGEQYGEKGLVAVAVHPGAVKTRMAEGNTPEDFLPYLVDDVDLCGAVCVWLSKQIQDLRWLTGRLISANWDMGELLEKKGEIVEKDLLKFAMATS